MTFVYKGYRADGSRASGRIEAADVRDAARRLRDSGVFARKIESLSAPGVSWKSSLSEPERAALWRELGALLGAGLAPDRALALLRSSDSGRVAALERVEEGVRAGRGLAASLEGAGIGVGSFERAALSSAEASATLPRTLVSLADELDARVDARSRVRSALAYPCFVLALGVLVAAGMLGLVVPRTAMMLAASGMELPPISRALVAAARWAVLLAAPSAVVLVCAWALAAVRARRDRAVAVALDRALLRLPPFKLAATVAARRFSAVLSALCEGGMPVADAMPLAASAMGHPFLEEAALGATSRVRAGESLSASLSEVPIIGGELARWAAVGENAGCLPEMLSVAAARFRVRWERALSIRLAMLEPAMLAGVGLFVFVLALALLLPVLSMTKSLGI